jgi:hypothetical protein
VALAPGLHPAVREALDEAELTGLFESAPSAEAGPYPDLEAVQRRHGVTWVELARLEPRVETLLWRARMEGSHCRSLADVEEVFGPLRDELLGLIGFAGKHHEHPVLGTAGSYAVAHWTLYDALAAWLSGAEEEPGPGA